MRKIILIPVCVLALFVAEFFLFNLIGRNITPNLLLLAVIYFDLVFGIRFSIYAAVLGGLLKDSFSTGVFGIHIFAMVLCAYLTTVLKRYLHYIASRSSRLLLVFLIAAIYFLVQLFVRTVLTKVDVGASLLFVFLPQAFMTLIVTPVVFTELKRCVSRLFT